MNDKATHYPLLHQQIVTSFSPCVVKLLLCCHGVLQQTQCCILCNSNRKHSSQGKTLYSLYFRPLRLERVISSLACWLFLPRISNRRVRQGGQGQEQDVGKGELEVKILATLNELDTPYTCL